MRLLSCSRHSGSCWSAASSLTAVQMGSRAGRPSFMAVALGLPVYPFQRRQYWLDLPTRAPVSGSGSKNLLPNHADPLSSKCILAAPQSSIPEHLDEPPSPGGGGGGANSTWHEQLGRLPPEERRVTLQGLVQDEVAAVLGYTNRQGVPPSAWDESILDIGCDSASRLEYSWPPTCSSTMTPPPPTRWSTSCFLRSKYSMFLHRQFPQGSVPLQFS
ncbi:hypothetical protein BO78DRAFT_195650 [Aspergillus sclerotiicarbonarius CBS 121057]|uniref:Carrier domain-containing protein n=1 Tax=Aspergillus sclerotiicarbonarius (strain CBS 121057 / IBT 28362) TaxID=1448318 RepID=A0A319E093_ASPSB|nr:hypothetical protein BO78DRAFT_195650 [Aspergillus sclerotiicarbonarius CBS 121057]